MKQKSKGVPQAMPLTQAQAAIWYAQKKTGDSRPYQIGGSVRLAGEIDFPRLRAAIERLVRENEGLRVQFYERDGQVQSYLADPGRVAVGWKDFSCSDDPQRAMERWARAHLGAPFSMLDSPLYAFTLFRIAPKETGYFIKLHHLIADGWSVELITRRIQQAYESGPEEGLPAPTVLSWQSYLTAEQSMLHSSRMEEHVAFWVERLSPIPALELPDRPVGEAARENFVPAPEQTATLRRLAREWGVSVNALWTALVYLWFYKRYGQTDVVLGIPLLGRSGRLERETIATFTNTMPVRLRIDGGAGAMEFVQAVAGELEEGYRHQKAPYLQVFHRLRAAYPGLERLYDVCVNCYNTLPAGSVGGLEAVNTEYPREVQEYSLQIILRSWNGTALQIDYDYRLDRYTRSQVARMHLELMLLLEQAAQAPARAVEKLCLLTPEEFRHRVYDWNQTNAPFPEKETVLDRVISMGEGFPDRPAVQFGEGSWSYAQLLCQTRRYAAWLWQQGVRPGMTVGLLAEHSPECLAGALAIFWCGGVYQPIDPSDPLPRVEELLALSGAGMLVVSRGQTAGRVPAIRLEEAPENWDDGLLPRPRFFQTAYCITTSGSSGRPKGVLVSHHSLMNYLWWAKGQYCCGGKERFALYSSFAFDFTLTSFFLPLVCGQPVRLYPGQREGNVFERMFRMGEVTVLKITPSHIPLLLDALPAPTTLHTLILGGENLSAARCAELAGAMGGSVRLFNEYGPTEATVGCMIHQYEAKDAGRDTVPLGRPIANTRVYLLDADGVPVPGGAVGELAVGGEGVALGYCDPAETARCFSSDPYAAGRMYYTGDMARIEPDGAVVMVGRRDEEVKIRGHRVCPAEIENSILRSGLVADARVAPRQIGAEKLLCAYLVGADGGTRQIREYCAAHLPSHLVPAWFCEVERIPVTRGGKLDLARLPMPNEEAPAPPDAPAPPSENLALLIGVMRTVLEGEIGPQDNFYALGGDSIKAIQISSRLRERGASLSVGDILRNPQLTRMADFMSRSDADETAKEAQGEVPVTPPIRWFLDQHLAEQGQYNQSMLLRLLRPMSAAQVGPVLEALVQHHDALRLNLDKDGRLFYNPAHRAARVPVEEMSIDRLEEIHRLETSFDLSHQLLLRARMVHCGEERYLFLTLHHLVVDGVSWRILLDDLAALFARQERGEDLRLGPKSDSYQTFARMLTGLDEPPCPACACDGFLRADAHVDHVILPRAVTASLLARREERRRVQDVLLTALYQSLRKTGWDSPLLLEREGHGRDRVPQANTERTVGWFTSFERILVSDGNEGDNTPPDTRVPGQEEEARYGASLVRWNYLGELNEEANGYFEPIPAIWRGDHSPKNRAGCRLCVDVLIARGQLEAYFTYSSKDADCQKLSRCFIKTLESILADYPGRLSARP